MNKARANCLLQIVALSAALLPAGTTAAQASRVSKSEDEGWAPVKHLEFTAEDIEGGFLGPDGALIVSVNRAEHPSLIELRAGFEAEIVKTMENF
ncbi:MAG TPA: hypothetical protein VIM14_14770 [Polyangia bacterium]